MEKKKTIRRQAHRLLLGVVIFCIIILVFSGIATLKIFDASHILFSSNNALSEFYHVVSVMDSNARGCLFPHNEAIETAYTESLAQAKSCLMEIYNVGDEQLTWRFQRLENMLASYNNVFTEYQQGCLTAYDANNQLNYQCFLIHKTATDYYGYLSEYMHSHEQQIQLRWRMGLIVQIAALFIVIVVGILVNRYTDHHILRPIQILTRNASRIRESNFELEPVGNAPLELTIMADTFSEMAAQVEQNIEVLTENSRLEQKLLQQESEQLVMQNLVTQAELRSLQAQINPHFLFNTLSMISKSAYLSQDVTTSELIDRLAGFLRYALDKSSTTTTLREEIQSVQDYFFIQKRRFGDQIQFEVSIGENVPELEMPAIILQPLVENSIKYGFGADPQPLVISLKVRFREGRVRITLEDDGVGIQPEQLENLQSCLRLGLESSSGRPGTSIGLTNVYRRLKMYFGNEMQFLIESEVNCGTVIIISVPWKEDA